MVSEIPELYDHEPMTSEQLRAHTLKLANGDLEFAYGLMSEVLNGKDHVDRRKQAFIDEIIRNTEGDQDGLTEEQVRFKLRVIATRARAVSSRQEQK